MVCNNVFAARYLWWAWCLRFALDMVMVSVSVIVVVMGYMLMVIVIVTVELQDSLRLSGVVHIESIILVMYIGMDDPVISKGHSLVQCGVIIQHWQIVMEALLLHYRRIR